MNFLRRHGGEHMGLKMTAMIDVVFLLLVFFVTTTRFRIPEGELDAYLPEEGAPVKPIERKLPVDEIRITLRIASNAAGDSDIPPEVFLDGVRIGASVKSIPTMAQLYLKLKVLAADEEVREKVPVIIDPQETLAYRWVIDALNACRLAKFEKVHFAASRASAPPPGS
jgi:biopolymer transport protein ExbD